MEKRGKKQTNLWNSYRAAQLSVELQHLLVFDMKIRSVTLFEWNDNTLQAKGSMVWTGLILKAVITLNDRDTSKRRTSQRREREREEVCFIFQSAFSSWAESAHGSMFENPLHFYYVWKSTLVIMWESFKFDMICLLSLSLFGEMGSAFEIFLRGSQ